MSDGIWGCENRREKEEEWKGYRTGVYASPNIEDKKKISYLG